MTTTSELSETVDRHVDRFLALPGCSAISVGKKTRNGIRTDRDAIVLHVERKHDPDDPGLRIPAELEGHPTDVVEEQVRIHRLATDPFSRHDPVLSGLALSAVERPLYFGSIGCFIDVDGRRGIDAGVYLITCQHVLAAAGPAEAKKLVVQPGGKQPPDADAALGTYVTGNLGPDVDCALVHVDKRKYSNEMPAPPGHPGHWTLGGIGTAQLNSKIAKFGAATGYTEAQISSVNYNASDGATVIKNAIRLQSLDGKPWVNEGDSGAVIVDPADEHTVVGLIFGGNDTTGSPDKGGYTTGFAYQITDQISWFSKQAVLAK